MITFKFLILAVSHVVISAWIPTTTYKSGSVFSIKQPLRVTSIKIVDGDDCSQDWSHAVSASACFAQSSCLPSPVFGTPDVVDGESYWYPVQFIMRGAYSVCVNGTSTESIYIISIELKKDSFSCPVARTCDVTVWSTQNGLLSDDSLMVIPRSEMCGSYDGNTATEKEITTDEATYKSPVLPSGYYALCYCEKYATVPATDCTKYNNHFQYAGKLTIVGINLTHTACFGDQHCFFVLSGTGLHASDTLTPAGSHPSYPDEPSCPPEKVSVVRTVERTEMTLTFEVPARLVPNSFCYCSSQASSCDDKNSYMYLAGQIKQAGYGTPLEFRCKPDVDCSITLPDASHAVQVSINTCVSRSMIMESELNGSELLVKGLPTGEYYVCVKPVFHDAWGLGGILIVWGNLKLVTARPHPIAGDAFVIVTVDIVEDAVVKCGIGEQEGCDICAFRSMTATDNGLVLPAAEGQVWCQQMGDRCTQSICTLKGTTLGSSSGSVSTEPIITTVGSDVGIQFNSVVKLMNPYCRGVICDTGSCVLSDPNTYALCDCTKECMSQREVIVHGPYPLPPDMEVPPGESEISIYGLGFRQDDEVAMEPVGLLPRVWVKARFFDDVSATFQFDLESKVYTLHWRRLSSGNPSIEVGRIIAGNSQDCIVSKWEVEPCPVPCGEGVTRQKRSIIQEADGFGKKCPILMDEVPCQDMEKCPVWKSVTLDPEKPGEQEYFSVLVPEDTNLLVFFVSEGQPCGAFLAEEAFIGKSPIGPFKPRKKGVYRLCFCSSGCRNAFSASPPLDVDIGLLKNDEDGNISKWIPLWFAVGGVSFLALLFGVCMYRYRKKRNGRVMGKGENTSRRGMCSKCFKRKRGSREGKWTFFKGKSDKTPLKVEQEEENDVLAGDVSLPEPDPEQDSTWGKKYSTLIDPLLLLDPSTPSDHSEHSSIESPDHAVPMFCIDSPHNDDENESPREDGNKESPKMTEDKNDNNDENGDKKEEVSGERSNKEVSVHDAMKKENNKRVMDKTAFQGFTDAAPKGKENKNKTAPNKKGKDKKKQRKKSAADKEKEESKDDDEARKRSECEEEAIALTDGEGEEQHQTLAREQERELKAYFVDKNALPDQVPFHESPTHRETTKTKEFHDVEECPQKTSDKGTLHNYTTTPVPDSSTRADTSDSTREDEMNASGTPRSEAQPYVPNGETPPSEYKIAVCSDDDSPFNLAPSLFMHVNREEEDRFSDEESPLTGEKSDHRFFETDDEIDTTAKRWPNDGEKPQCGEASNVINGSGGTLASSDSTSTPVEEVDVVPQSDATAADAAHAAAIPEAGRAYEKCVGKKESDGIENDKSVVEKDKAPPKGDRPSEQDVVVAVSSADQSEARGGRERDKSADHESADGIVINESARDYAYQISDSEGSDDEPADGLTSVHAPMSSELVSERVKSDEHADVGQNTNLTNTKDRCSPTQGYAFAVSEDYEEDGLSEEEDDAAVRSVPRAAPEVPLVGPRGNSFAFVSEPVDDAEEDDVSELGSPPAMKEHIEAGKNVHYDDRTPKQKEENAFSALAALGKGAAYQEEEEEEEEEEGGDILGGCAASAALSSDAVREGAYEDKMSEKASRLQPSAAEEPREQDQEDYAAVSSKLTKREYEILMTMSAARSVDTVHVQSPNPVLEDAPPVAAYPMDANLPIADAHNVPSRRCSSEDEQRPLMHHVTLVEHNEMEEKDALLIVDDDDDGCRSEKSLESVMSPHLPSHQHASKSWGNDIRRDNIDDSDASMISVEDNNDAKSEDSIESVEETMEEKKRRASCMYPMTAKGEARYFLDHNGKITDSLEGEEDNADATRKFDPARSKHYGTLLEDGSNLMLHLQHKAGGSPSPKKAGGSPSPKNRRGSI